MSTEGDSASSPSPERLARLLAIGSETETASAGAAGGDADDLPRIEGYEVLERIGSGGMGVVFRAIQLGTRRTVALKVLGTVLSPTGVARFHREVELASTLNHPGIARVYDSGLHRGCHYYAMELIDGVPLNRYAAGAALAPRRAMALIKAVCDAVQHAHQRGVIHRDLKPSNILVSADGQPHVLDFGLAKACGEPEMDMTLPGEVAGTLSYMAPEQAAGHISEVGTHSDVYSIGLMLYELLAGRLPRDLSGQRLELLRRIAEDELPSPQSAIPGIDAELAILLQKAVAHDPACRYGNAGELGRDIDNYLEGNPLAAKAPTLAYVLRKHIRRHRIPVAAGGVVLLLLAGLAVYSYVRIAAARDDALASAERAQRATASERVQRGVAEQQRAVAEAADRQNRRRLINNYVAEGWAHHARGDSGAALLRFVEALRMEEQEAALPDGTSGSVAMHRIRIGAVLAEAPLPQFVLSHGGQVNDIAFSRDGTLVATAGSDGTARIWDARTGERRYGDLRHGGPVTSVAFSDDGHSLLTASHDRTARVWDLSGDPPTARTMAHTGSVRLARFAPRHQMIVTLDHDSAARVHTWNAQTLAHIESVDIYASFFGLQPWLATSRDGRYLVAPLSATKAGLTSLDSSLKSATMTNTDDMLMHAAIGDDGRRVATLSLNGWAHVWEVDIRGPGPGTGTKVFSVRHSAMAHHYRAAFSPDGRLLATAGGDPFVRLWDATTGQSVLTVMRHTGGVQSLAFSPDGRWLGVAASDGLAHVWRMPRIGEAVRAIPQISNACGAFCADGRRIVLSGHEPRRARALLIDAATGRTLLALPHQLEVTCAVENPDGMRIATVSLDKSARIWDAWTGQPLTPPLMHPDALDCVSFSRDGRRIITSGSLLEAAYVWDVRKGELIAKFDHARVHTAGLNRDGTTAFTVGQGESGDVCVWDVAVGMVKATLRHDSAVSHAELSPDESCILTVSDAVRIWKPEGGCLASFGNAPSAAAFSPDGRTIAIASKVNCSAQILDATSHRPISLPMAHADQIRRLAFSADGRILATGSGDGVARLWDAATGQALTPPLQYSAKSFDPATLSDETRQFVGARLKEAAGREIELAPMTFQAIGQLALSPDGHRLLVSPAGGDASVRDFMPDGRPMTSLALLAQVLAAERIDSQSLAVPLEPSELLTAWQRFSAGRAAETRPATMAVPSP